MRNLFLLFVAGARPFAAPQQGRLHAAPGRVISGNSGAM
jgi:hypothetical protein